MITVEAIHVAPVKSLGLLRPASVQVGATGIDHDRRFYLIDDRGVLLTQRQAGVLVRVRAEYCAEYLEAEESLRLTFPDGSVIEGRVDTGEPVVTRIWGRQVNGRQVTGDWNKMLSKFCGRPVTLVQSRLPGQCFDEFPISILSGASVETLGRQAGVGAALDHRRFRPNFLISGCDPHQEDAWSGQTGRLRQRGRAPGGGSRSQVRHNHTGPGYRPARPGYTLGHQKLSPQPASRVFRRVRRGGTARHSVGGRCGDRP